MYFLHPPLTRWNKIILGTLIILSIVILTLHFREKPTGLLHQAQRFSLNLMAPLQAGVSKIIKPLRQGGELVLELGYLRRDNERLKKERDELRQQLVLLRELKKENLRLRKMVGFQEKTPFNTLPAHVIGKSPTDWQATIVLDKGLSDGVTKNMPVVTSEGLVGQVIEVSTQAAQVQLIIDQKSGVGARIQETEEFGIVEGQINGELKLNYVPKSARVKKGDRAATSGLGGIFPKGILIGTVIGVRDRLYELHKDVRVRPAVDFSRLEEVLVITNPPPKPPFEF